MRGTGGDAVNHYSAIVLPQIARVMNSHPGIVLESLPRRIVVVNLEHVIFLFATKRNPNVSRKILSRTADAPRGHRSYARIPIVGGKDVRVIRVTHNAFRLRPQIQIFVLESSLGAFEQSHVMNCTLLGENIFRQNRLESDDVMFPIQIWCFEDLAPVDRVVAFMNRHLK